MQQNTGSAYLFCNHSKSWAHIFIILIGSAAQRNVRINPSISVHYRDVVKDGRSNRCSLCYGERIWTVMKFWCIVIDIQNWYFPAQRHCIGFWSCNSFIWKNKISLISLTSLIRKLTIIYNHWIYHPLHTVNLSS